MKRTSSWRTAFSRGLAALTAVLIVGTMRPAHSSPGEIFSIAAPAITDSPPATGGIADGESGVSTSTGAFTYSYPIGAPPGRGEMRPSISLQYSSQAPIYGTLAAGWTLSGLPIITEESSGGRLWGTATIPSLSRYQSSLSGNRPLFVVTEASPAGTTPYRAQNDGSWLRYQYHPTGEFWWRALSPNGTSYYFGHKDAHTSGCTIVSRGYAPVTRIEDEFSNQIDFYYEQGVAGECRIRAITWGHNPVTGMNPFAAMLFTYATTPPGCNGVAVGSQSSYRSGTMIVTGASQLLKIESIAYPPASSGGIAPPPPLIRDHTRTITLGYSSATASCSAAHAPYRALTSIQESAVGTDSPQVDLPEITFGYGDASVNYGAAQSPSVPWASTGLAWAYNLGWGYRPQSADAWPTVEAMMLDVDADGLIDRVVSEPVVDASSRTTRCRARWYRNRGPAFGGTSQFTAAGYVDMPTLKWATDIGLPAYDGGAHAGDNPSTGTNERCALNYQRSGYRNSNPSLLVTCPPNNQACPQQQGTNPPRGWCAGSTKSDCGIKTNNQGDTHFAWRWMDMDGDQKPDLVGSPVTGGVVSYDLQWGNLEGAPQEPSIFGAFPPCPSTPYSADPGNWQSEPYTMCGGMFPWFVYKNHGNGVFGTARPGGSGTTHESWGPLPTQIIYQPIALETATGESSVTSRPVGQDQGTVDIDGDGFADAVRRDASSWKVYRNDGSGLFTPLAGGTPFVFGTGTSSFLSRTNYVAAQNPATAGIEGLEDFNGDGLVDHWAGTGPMVDLRYNDGLTFQTLAVSVDRPGPDGESSVLFAESKGAPSYYVCRGFRADHRRTLDLDSDSRADLFVTVGGVPGVRYNAGGQFTTSSSTSLGSGGGFHRLMVDSNDVAACSGTSMWWMKTQDLIDLDGDGVQEDVEFNMGQMYLRSVINPAPRRLLVSINNQRGATTTIAYSSMNGPAVTQQPDLNKASPTTGWVVQSVTTADSFSSTSSTTTYAYRRPNVGKDADAPFANRFAFRGFEEVTTTNPGPTGAANGSSTIHRYGYDVDWSGRLVATIVKPSFAESVSVDEVRTMEKTTWQSLSLFNGALKTYHPLRTESFTCANGQDEATCTPAAASGYVRTEISYTAYPDTPAPNDEMLWTSSRSLLKSAIADANGDRETLSTFTLAATPTTYELRPYETTRNHRLGAMALFGKSRSTWNASTRELTEETWVDSVDANRTVARSVLDTTGNVIEQWKPVQNAAGTTFTQYIYDSRKLFAASETNELTHLREFTWEYGTGTKLMTDGPNVRGCITGPGCPSDATHPLKEQNKIRIDGLGRTIERSESFSADGYLYQLYLVETNSYTAATATVPESVFHQQLLDVEATTWKQDKSEFDGHGRPIKQTVYVQGTAPVDQITTFQYRADGTLATVAVPDPTANNATTVAYAYSFDSLGRPTSIRRPDSTVPASQSGVDIAYDGLTQTTTEFVGAGLGQIGVTKTINDRFSRLAQVHEKTGTSTWAITNYAYGPDDLVASIVDPQGVTSALAHDFAGRRVQVTRGTRVWKYTYDKNGNLIAEQVPGSAGILTDPDYTTTTVYDALDRPLSKVVGQRGISAPDQNAFGNKTEVFVYDVDGNMKGRLRQHYAYAPDGSWTVGEDFRTDIQGRPSGTTQQLRVAGLPHLVREIYQSWYVTGEMRHQRHGDILGAGTVTTWAEYFLDARGLPQKATIRMQQSNGSGATYQDVAVQTRNVAGLVTKRRSSVAAPTSYVESNWTYDKLGRVTDQIVQKASSPTQIVRQDLAYFGNDDVKTLRHYLGAADRLFTHEFDLRHQLTKVTTNTTSYFGANYVYGDAGRLTRAQHTRNISPPPSGSDPKLVRNVDYFYQGADPEQVTSLKIIGSGATYASYTYDAAGNQLTRSYPSTNELWDYAYDGKDQLRRVTRKFGGVVTGSEEYWYNAAGQRIAIVKKDASGVRTEMIWFIGDTQAHYNGAGAVTHIYSNISMGTPVARVDRTADTTTSLEFQFHGLASSTIAAVAQNGTINASFSYAPFGEVLEATNAGGTAQGTPAHKRRFNDKFEDDIGGLAYYGARFYDKTLIGWTQADPLFRFAPDAAWVMPRKANLHVFSLQNSLRYLDPDGLAPGDASWLKAQDRQSAFDRKTIQEHETEVITGAPANGPGSPGWRTNGSAISVATPLPGVGQGGAIANLIFDIANGNAPDPLDRGSTGGGGGGAGRSGGGGGQAGGPHLDPPNEHTVVRGGQTPLPTPGTPFSGAAGKNLVDAAQGVPHGKVRETTAGQIRAGGGTVTRVPEPTRSGKMNDKHVDVCVGPGPCPFGELKDNPVPKKDRVD